MKQNKRNVNKSQLRQLLRNHDLATRELKMQTIVSGGTNSTSGAVVGITVNNQQGDNVSNRTGYIINVHSLKVAAQCTMNASAGADRFRLIVFYDRLNLNSTPAVTDVLDTASVLSDYTYFARTTNRFKILMDKVFAQSINGDSRAINFEKEWKFKNPIPVCALGTTTNNGKNSMFYLVISDTVTTLSTYAVSTTIRYFDD